MRKLTLLLLLVLMLTSCKQAPEELVCDEKVISENTDDIYTLFVYIIHVESDDLFESAIFNTSTSVDLQYYDITPLEQFNGPTIESLDCVYSMTRLYDTETNEDVSISIAEILELEPGNTYVIVGRNNAIGVSGIYENILNLRHATLISDYNIDDPYENQTQTVKDEVEEIVETYKNLIPFPY